MEPLDILAVVFPVIQDTPESEHQDSLATRDTLEKKEKLEIQEHQAIQEIAVSLATQVAECRDIPGIAGLALLVIAAIQELVVRVGIAEPPDSPVLVGFQGTLATVVSVGIAEIQGSLDILVILDKTEQAAFQDTQAIQAWMVRMQWQENCHPLI
jgi:hypothetical protein